MRRPDPNYERLSASQIHDTTGKDPNEYRDLTILWAEVQGAVTDVNLALSGDIRPLRQALLGLHVTFSFYTLRQGVFINRTVLEKYPGHCPYCQYQECLCRQISQGEAERNPSPITQLFLPEHVRPETAQRTIVQIYSQANQDRTLEQLWDAVVSELGEVEQWIDTWERTQQLNQAEAKDFHFELADSQARLYGVLDRVGVDLGDTLSQPGGPPYRGTDKPKIHIATTYTPLPEL